MLVEDELLNWMWTDIIQPYVAVRRGRRRRSVQRACCAGHRAFVCVVADVLYVHMAARHILLHLGRTDVR